MPEHFMSQVSARRHASQAPAQQGHAIAAAIGRAERERHLRAAAQHRKALYPPTDLAGERVHQIQAGSQPRPPLDRREADAVVAHGKPRKAARRLRRAQRHPQLAAAAIGEAGWRSSSIWIRWNWRWSGRRPSR